MTFNTQWLTTTIVNVVADIGKFRLPMLSAIRSATFNPLSVGKTVGDHELWLELGFVDMSDRAQPRALPLLGDYPSGLGRIR